MRTNRKRAWLLIVATSLFCCTTTTRGRLRQRPDCYEEAVRYLILQNQLAFSQLECRKSYPNDSILQLCEFCSLVGKRDYSAAEGVLNKLVAKRAFPCIDSLAGIWHWEFAQMRANPDRDIDGRVDYLLEYLRNYSYSPC